MNENSTYQRASVWVGLIYFIFFPKRYLKCAALHSIAINLEAPDISRKYSEGKYEPDYNKELTAVIKFRKELYKSLTKSLLAVLITVSIAIIIAHTNDSISAHLPFSLQRTLQVVSTCLVMWAALFKLGWGIRTNKGEALHELLHGLLFNIIFLFGSFLALLSFLI